MNKSIRKHREQMKKTINNLKSTNPKEYWKIIITGIKQIIPDIPIDVLLNFFKTMNVGTQDDDSIHKLDHINEIDNLNIIINSPVTKDEIEKGIKRLKNEKSSAEDQIVN